MNNNDIGGFFATLGLLVDKNSFETGNKAVDAVTNKLSKLAGTVRNVSAIMGTYAVATGKIEANELKTAEALGISTEKLNQWKTAAKLAGANANSFVSSITQMEMAMQNMKDGHVDTALAEKIGQLGIDFNDFMDMDATDRLTAIFNAAQKMDDQALAAKRVQALLGDAGFKFYGYMIKSNESVDDILKKADKINLTNENDYDSAFQFDSAVNEMQARIEALNKEFGSELDSALAPAIQGINTWLSEHGDTIAEDLDAIAEVVGKIAEKVGAEVGDVADAIFDNHTDEEALTTNGVAGVIEKTKAVITDPGSYFDAAAEQAEIQKLLHAENVKKNGFWRANALFGLQSRIAFDDLSPELQERMRQYEAKGGDLDYFRDTWRSGGDLAKEDKTAAAIGTKNSSKTTNAIEDKTVPKIEQQPVLDKETPSAPKKAIEGDKETPKVETAVGTEETNSKKKGKKKNNKVEIDDGIMRPDGTVTQVAPDDWVFAARNVSDLAAAFMPQTAGGVSAGPTTYTITQTFNINGTGGLMPQTIRQQAYMGTQSAIQETVAKSANRLQSIPGAN